MFRALGFDVRVRPGFVIFMLLIVVLYGDEFGLWLAGSIAAFTLIHELGHAVVARRYGAQAEISLDFLAGYTSFRPTRPMSLAQHATVSFAGPAVHIVASLGVLGAMGVNPLDRVAIRDTAATAAIWWAGPVIGLFNLIPVLPLDGGHIVQAGLERLIGERALRVMTIASLVVTGSFAVWCYIDPDRRGFAIFVMFLMFSQFQLLGATSTRTTAARDRQVGAAAEAELAAWQTGHPGMLVPGQELSPWYRAHRFLLAGRPDQARTTMLDDLHADGPRRWLPPVGANETQLRAVLDVLPRPLPRGNPGSEHVLAEVALRVGEPALAGHYAADTFATTRHTAAALVVARAAAVLGDRDTAVRWLHAASTTAGGGATLVEAIDSAPELAALRDDPEVRGLRQSITSG